MTSRNRSQSRRRIDRTMSSRNSSFGGQEVELIGRYVRKYSVPVKPNPYALGRNMVHQNSFHGTNSYQNYGGYQQKYSPLPMSAPVSYENSSRPQHGRELSNLMQPGNTSSWNVTSVANETEDMATAMNNLIGDHANKINRKVDFLDELQMLAEADELFCHLPNADDWSFKEVCYWMSTINLEKYIPAFENQIIDGSILLRDLDENMLTNELGVKRLHVKKMMREIKKLRDMSPKFSKISDNTRDALLESLRMEMNVIKRENTHLKLQVERYKQQQTNSIFANISRRNSTIADRARSTDGGRNISTRNENQVTVGNTSSNRGGNNMYRK